MGRFPLVRHSAGAPKREPLSRIGPGSAAKIRNECGHQNGHGLGVIVSDIGAIGPGAAVGRREPGEVGGF